MRLLLKTITTFCLLLYAACGHAQTATEHEIEWPTDHGWEKHSLLRPKTDSTILEMIVAQLRKGTINCYSYTDQACTVPMTQPEIEELFRAQSDTVTVTDPITGDEVQKVTLMEFNFLSVVKYRVQATAATTNGKKEYKMEQLTPVQEEYAMSGRYIGLKPLFRLRYADVLPIIRRYEQWHPDNTLASRMPQ